MFRIAALVAGALAGFVASLILALGGLEVTASAFGGLGERQLALARFGLIFIANLSLLGAGVSLAVPRAGAILLLLAGAAWAGAALYLGHSTDMVLLGPPVLAFLGFVLAIFGDIRSRRPAARSTSSTEPMAERYTPPDPYDVAPAAFRGGAAVASSSTLSSRDPLDGISERDFIPGRLNGRSDRKVPPAPVATPSFRELEEEEEEYEPSVLRRLGGGVASLLSFGLYAAAAVTVLLVIYNLYQRDNSTALVADTAASATSVAEAAPPPSSSIQPVAPAPVVVVTPPAPPSSSAPPPAPVSTTLAAPTPPAAAPSSEPVRIVGEPAPENAVPATSSSVPPPASSAVELEPSPQPSSEPVAVAEAAPLPTPDFVDNTKTAPIPAVMSPQLAAARRAGAFDNIRPDSFAVAPAFAGSDI